MRGVIAIALVLALLLTGVCLAGLSPDAKVIVHVLPHTSRTCTKNFPTGISTCEDIITTEASTDCDCFPVFFNLTEYQGFDYSMTWPGTYSCVFTSCSVLTIGGIQWPGQGVSHAW